MILSGVGSQNAPTVKTFYVFIYSDSFMHKPTLVWQFYIHAVKRMDLQCIQSQTTRATLVLSCTSNGLHELHLLVRPSKPGFCSYCVNAVDIELHQIIDTWLIRVQSRLPNISKRYEQTVQIGQSQPMSKRISYTNPYSLRKTFCFNTSHPDLLQLHHAKLDFQPNEKRFLSFTLLPLFQITIMDIFILINNEDDTNEDAY
ncbi:unnamed protein product, partial [Didymodactylos carnosus]